MTTPTKEMTPEELNKMRAEFEATEQGKDLSRAWGFGGSRDEYADPYVQARWVGWQRHAALIAQARASLPTAPAAPERQDAQGQPDGWEIVDPDAKVDRLRKATQALLDVAVKHEAMGEDSALSKVTSEADDALAACVGWVAAPAPEEPAQKIVGSIDTLEFYDLLNKLVQAVHAEEFRGTGKARMAINAHIDAHVATKVQAARDEALEEAARIARRYVGCEMIVERILALRSPAATDAEGK